MGNEKLSYDDLVQDGVAAILRSFGKGEDLRGAVAYIIQASAQWGADNAKAQESKKNV